MDRFWDIARYWSKIAAWIRPPLFGAPSGVIPLEFRLDFWHRKTRLSYGVVYEILHLVVLIQHRCVIDGQTDRWTNDDSIYSASIASHRKSWIGIGPSGFTAKCATSSYLLSFYSLFSCHNSFTIFIPSLCSKTQLWSQANSSRHCKQQYHFPSISATVYLCLILSSHVHVWIRTNTPVSQAVMRLRAPDVASEYLTGTTCRLSVADGTWPVYAAAHVRDFSIRRPSVTSTAETSTARRTSAGDFNLTTTVYWHTCI